VSADPREDPLSGERDAFALFVRRPIAMVVLLATALVLGAIAYRRIPIQMFPSGLVEPEIGIEVPNPGSSAQENEDKVARVIEEQLRTLSGVERLRSWSRDDWVRLRLDFDAGIDMDLALAEVRDRIERARAQLPTTVEQINLWTEDADQMPILWMGVLHTGDSEQTDFLIDKVLKPRIEAVPGVSRIDLWGDLQDTVRVLLDEERVKAAQLDLGALIRRLSADNFTQPLGELSDAGERILLRSDMRFKSLEEIERYPVGNGMTIADLGEVRRVKSVRNRLSRIDGKYSYFGAVTKESGANVVETSRLLLKRIDELERSGELRGQLKFVVFFSQGEVIETSLSQLSNTALTGGLLAIAVLLVFLRRLRVTLCVALSIPVSALFAIAFEYFTGGSLNLMTMTGLTLGLGMLVDNSIVVIENIARVRATGAHPHAAAARGAREIALAISLSTLTTVVVFLPLIFMSEQPILRAVLGALGLPLCTSLLFSLLVALVFLPVIAARIQGERPPWLKRALTTLAWLDALPALVVGGPLRLARALAYGSLSLATRLANAATRVLVTLRAPLALALLAAAGWFLHSSAQANRLALRAHEGPLARSGLGAPSAAVFAACIALAAAAALVFVLPRWRRRPAQLAPLQPWRGPSGPLEALADANRAVVGWSLAHRKLAFVIALAACASVWVPLTRMTLVPFGQDENNTALEFSVAFTDDFTLAEAADQMRIYEERIEARRTEWGYAHWNNRFDERGGSMNVFWDESQPPSRLDQLRSQLRRELPRVPGHELRFYQDQEGGAQGRAIATFTLQGPSARELEEHGARAVQLLRAVPGLTSVASPLESAPEQLRVVFDRDLALGLGVRPDIAQETIAWALRGFQLPRYQESGREQPFLIEYDQDSELGINSLRDLSVFSGVAPVPLSAFSEVEFAPGSRSIHRLNGQATFLIQGRVEDPTRIVEVTRAGEQALAGLELPRGFSVGRNDGAVNRQQQEMFELLRALALSVVLVFLLMGILFESILLPFSVLATMPFAVVGAMWTLYLTGTAMDSVGWIGVIILGGVVVNNGIVLVDCFHRLRQEGMPRTAAIVEGCAQRLRPILMTAMTTIFGLLPMALQESSGAGLDYRALATCVAGGLACSTVFTLWAVPLAYSLLDDLRLGSARWWRRWSPPERVPARAARALHASSQAS
jgi:HAE1 family hydrophobic/amphiphilic exporter-1